MLSVLVIQSYYFGPVKRDKNMKNTSCHKVVLIHHTRNIVESGILKKGVISWEKKKSSLIWHLNSCGWIKLYYPQTSL